MPPLPHTRLREPVLRALAAAARANAVRMMTAATMIVASVAFVSAPPTTQQPAGEPDAPTSARALGPDESARSNVVFDAWADYVMEREIEHVAGRYAERFRIPVRLATQIYSAASAEGIRPDVAFGLVRAESSFRPRAVSSAGAVGLTQVLPSTGRWIVPGTTRRDLLDTETNLRVGFRYLRFLYDKYDGNERLALTAYNRGPGTVDRHLRRGVNPDNGYVEFVLTGQSRRHTALLNARTGRRRG
jgi:soluble lytic murein transglycosylase-like protein